MRPGAVRSRLRGVAVAGGLGAGILAAPTLEAQYLRAWNIDSLPSKAATARIAYGRDSLQFGDLRLPRGRGPFPVAVVIHGGCWVRKYATLQNAAALADALRDAGIATWNIEYRRLDHPGGGWPGTFLDAADATDFLRVLARRYPLDTTRVLVMGHSAGGHLALWVAARGRLRPGGTLYRPDPLRPAAALDLAGPGSLAEIEPRAAEFCGGPVIDQLMGGTPEGIAERYQEGSPEELLPLGVPQALMMGDHDFVMPGRTWTGYVTRARDAGDPVEAVVLPDAGHFELIAPGTPAGKAVVAKARALLGLRP